MEELFYRRIHRRGGSYAVMLPRPLMRRLDLRNGDYLRWAVTDGRIALVREDPRDAGIRDAGIRGAAHEEGASEAPRDGRRSQ